MSLTYTLDSTGLTLPTYNDIITYLQTQMESIYGSDISVTLNDASSPDSQMLGIFTQCMLDLQDLLTQVYTSFDPDQAYGTVLDQRVSINGIQRQAGTYTITNITLINSTSVNLYGLDQDVEPVYTIADSAGTQWELVTTVLGLAAGTNVLVFQAATPGAVPTIPNTIVLPVTIVLGVTSVNNPTTYTTIGINEESDGALKIRRQKSIQLSSSGYYNGLIAALDNVSGVTSAFVYENTTSTTNSDGVPAHSIWVIVAGSASASDIAEAIYSKRSSGCGMYGATSLNVLQDDGSYFTVYWDVVVTQNLFMKATLSALDGVTPQKISAIKTYLFANFVPGVYGLVNSNELDTLIQDADPNSLSTNSGFSLTAGGSYTSTLQPTTKNKQFVLSSGNIILLPMILSSADGSTVVSGGVVVSTVSVAHTATEQFTALGGYGTMVYSISVNNSGGSINSSSGLYTAGSAGFVDTILVTDGQSNTATATVTVT